uniref:UDP-glucuronosyltransferase n=1 Tax=Panagrolaimus superbus TaxID=310955 RepID=A0A914YU07_9BILA
MLWTKTAHGYLVPLMYHFQSKTFNQFVVDSNGMFFEALNLEFDVVIVDELLTQHGIVAANILKDRKNIPHIIYSPTIQTYWYQSKIALSRNYVIADSLMGPIPSESTDFYKPSKFFDRLIAFSENYVEVFLMDWWVMPTAPYFLPGVNMERHYTNAYFTFGEHIDRLGNPMTEGSDLILVGSNCKSASSVANATLSKEWKEFVEDPKSKGTIYIAFGSALLWDYMSNKVKDSFIAAINKLDEYRIIFSWNGQFPKTVKSNIKFTKWAPQMAILSHPKTIVFLTHGGLKSLKESLCAEVPIVLMPLLAEQVYNAKFCLKLGIGLVLNKYELNSEQIATTLRK